MFRGSQCAHTQVEQVNFLRAKARYDRWNEECTKTRDHMGNTIRHMQDEWQDRAERAEEQSGQRYYAYQQAGIWSLLAERAEKSFGQNAC